MVRKAVTLTVLIFLVALSGCKSSLDYKILGKWVCKSSGDRMELLKDHSCFISSMGFDYPGKWTLSGDKVSIDAKQIQLDGSFDGTKIEVEDAAMHYKYVYEQAPEAGSVR